MLMTGKPQIAAILPSDTPQIMDDVPPEPGSWEVARDDDERSAHANKLDGVPHRIPPGPSWNH